MKIKDIPINLRPREKALLYGIEKLSDVELLTLIIGSGGKGNSAIDIANELIKSNGTSLENLAKTNYVSLQQYLGLKQSIALRLLATFEFHNRLNRLSYQKVDKIECSKNVYDRYKYLEDFSQEVLMIIMLNHKKEIIREKTLYKGTFDSFEINVKQIIEQLLLAKANYFVLIHNHLDEVSYPSKEDIYSTKVIKKSASLLDVKMLDHVIIFKGGFCSIKSYIEDILQEKY